jgi:hypothetical protein
MGISPTDYRERFLQKVDFVVDRNGENAENGDEAEEPSGAASRLS